MMTPLLKLDVEISPVPVAEIPGFIFTKNAGLMAWYNFVIEQVAESIFNRP